jgi:hypothetical protein
MEFVTAGGRDVVNRDNGLAGSFSFFIEGFQKTSPPGTTLARGSSSGGRKNCLKLVRPRVK